MLALVWHQRGNVQVENVANPPRPGPTELQLRVLACGICGTDVEEVVHGPIFISGGSRSLYGIPPPIILGHEVIGIVVAVGADLDPRMLGKRVAVDGLVSCGACRYCLKHRMNLCERLGSVGLSLHGGMAEFMNAPGFSCVEIGSATPDKVAVLAEPLAVGVRALRRARFQQGDRVAVIGGGAVGLLVAQAANSKGAGEVIIVEPNEWRRIVAHAIGVARCVTPSNSIGIDADIVIECSGTEQGVKAALAASAKGARIVFVGLAKSNLPIEPLQLVSSEFELIGSLSHIYDQDFVEAVSLLNQGNIKADAMVTESTDLNTVAEYLLNENRRRENIVKLVWRVPFAQ